MKSTVTAAREAGLALLASRMPGGTVCPSEVARALATSNGRAADWRAQMLIVHAAVDQLLSEGAIQISWRGQTLTERTGPYRIGQVLDAIEAAKK